MSSLKKLFIALAGFLLIGGLAFLGIVYYAYTQLDEAAIKNMLTDLVAEQTQRPLWLSGTFTPHFFPLGINIEDMTLGERMGSVDEAKAGARQASQPNAAPDDGFASLSEVSLTIDTWALLDKRLVIEAIVLKQARINLVRDKHGHLNIDDLISPAPTQNPSPPPTTTVTKVGSSDLGSVSWSVTRLSVDSATINFRDEQSGEHFRVTDAQLALKGLALGNTAQLKAQATLSVDRPQEGQRATLTLSAEGPIRLIAAESNTGKRLGLEIDGLKTTANLQSQLNNVGQINVSSFSALVNATMSTSASNAPLINAQFREIALQATANLINTAEKNARPLTVKFGLNQGSEPLSLAMGATPAPKVSVPIFILNVNAEGQIGAMTLNHLKAEAALQGSLGNDMVSLVVNKMMAESQLSGDFGQAEASINLPRLSATLPLAKPQHLNAQWQGLSAQWHSKNAEQTIRAKIEQPQFQVNGAEGTFNGEPLTATLNVEAPSSTKSDTPLSVAAVLQTSLSGHRNATGQSTTLVLSPLSVKGTAHLPTLPKALPINLSGRVSMENGRAIKALLEGTLADTQLRLSAQTPHWQALPTASSAFSAFIISLAADQFDVDAWFPASKAPTTGAPPNAPAIASTNTVQDINIDLSSLQSIKGTIDLTLGHIKARGLTAKNINAKIEATGQNGQKIVLSPLSASVAEGTIKGAVTIGLAKNIAEQTFAVKAQASSIQIGQLLRDLGITDILKSKADLTMDINAVGASLQTLKSSLAGQISMKANDGAIRGFNVAKTMREATAGLAILQGANAAQTAKSQAKEELSTDFAELSASFTAQNGLLSTRDITMLSPYLRLLGEGTINLPQEQLDIRARVIPTTSSIGQGAGSVGGRGIPLKVSGAMSAPKINLDGDALKELYINAEKEKAQEKIKAELKAKEDTLREEAAKKIDEQKKKVQEKIQNKLKGLLGQ